MSSFQLRRDASGVPVAAYDSHEDLIKQTSVQKRWRSDFLGTQLNPAKWEVVQIGAGQSINVGGGQMQINLGTTNGAETIILSKEDFSVSLRAFFIGNQVSQKIANNEIYLELVSVDENGVPDERESAYWLCEGVLSTSTTNARYGGITGGEASWLQSGTISQAWTSASIREIELFADECWFHGRAVDSAAARSNSFVKHQNIPDWDRRYKVRIRVKNNGTPASNTVLTMFGVAVVDYAELTTEITASRGITSAGQAMGVHITGAATVTTQPLGRNIMFNENSTNHAANATINGSTRTYGAASGSTASYDKHVVAVTASQACTVYMEQGWATGSSDWRVMEVIDVPAGAGITLPAAKGITPLVMNHARIRIVNGPTAQTLFNVSAGFVAVGGVG